MRTFARHHMRHSAADGTATTEDHSYFVFK
jgi:hypothetical protein